VAPPPPQPTQRFLRPPSTWHAVQSSTEIHFIET
jgi:hypothetical protein